MREQNGMLRSPLTKAIATNHARQELKLSAEDQKHVLCSQKDDHIVEEKHLETERFYL